MNIQEKTINTLRILSAEMVQKANSGTPRPHGHGADGLRSGLNHEATSKPDWADRPLLCPAGTPAR